MTINRVPAGTVDPRDYDLVVHEVYVKGCNFDPLANADEVYREAAKTPQMAFCFSVGGYDNDPREVLDIPEVMAFLRVFITRLEALDRDKALRNRLDPDLLPLWLIATGRIRRGDVTIRDRENHSGH